MEKKSRGEFWVSLIISILALAVSAATLVYTIRRDRMNEVEMVEVYWNGYSYDENVFYDSAGGEDGKGTVDGLNHSIIITNNSKIRASVVNYEVYTEDKTGKKSCEHMIAEIKDALGNPIAFPITLEPGEAVAVQFEMKYEVPSNVNELLVNKYGETDLISYAELKKYLDENQMVIWKGGYMYHVELRTSQNNVSNLAFVYYE